MLDFKSLRIQIEEFKAFELQRTSSQHLKLQRALDQLRACGKAWPAIQQQLADKKLPWLVAYPLSVPDTSYDIEKRPSPITVTASDGSQIFPDPQSGLFWYLLQTGGVAFQYGTVEPPVFDQKVQLLFGEEDSQDQEHEDGRPSSIAYISALRDVAELEILLDVSKKTQQPGRPVLALVDGTLIRWMLRSMHQPDKEEELIRRYIQALEGFHQAGIPVCSYISRSAATEVVNLLRFSLGEHLGEVERDASLFGLTDHQLFASFLKPGQRSPLFQSRSRIQGRYPPDQRILFYYLHVPGAAGGEIARVEVPYWVGSDDRMLALTHSVLLNECEKGGGYPVILGEAHENVVIRASEKEMVYHLMAQVFQEAGLEFKMSLKNTFKKRPII